MPARLGSRIGRGVIGVACFLAVAHVLATLLYLMAESPVRRLAQGAVDAYMSPLFEQDWHLFAPDPLIASLDLAVRCRSAGPAGTVETSPWFQVSAEYNRRHDRDRLGGTQRLKRAFSYNYLRFGGTDPRIDAERLAQGGQDADPAARRLGRLASEACRRAVGEERLTLVQARVRSTPTLTPVVDGSPQYEAGVTEFPWMPVARLRFPLGAP